MAMFDVDDIRDWRGLPVVDKDGGRIGKLEAVYFDTATEEPTFATVKVGMPGGGRLVFVPPRRRAGVTAERPGDDRQEDGQGRSLDRHGR